MTAEINEMKKVLEMIKSRVDARIYSKRVTK